MAGCMFDPTKGHLVVHIVDAAIPFDSSELVMPYGRVEYRQWVRSDRALPPLLARLFVELRSCEVNALIVCTSAESDITEVMHRALHAALHRDGLLNLKIIHEVSTVEGEDINMPHPAALRNVVNIWPVSAAEAPEGTVVRSRSGMRFACTDKTLPIQESWWWKMHFRVPPCANGRTMQHRGTCWFNTALNVVLLSPALSRMAKAAYRRWRDKRTTSTGSRSLRLRGNTSYEDMCPDFRNPPPVEDMFFAVVHNLFYEGRRLSQSHGDPLMAMAGRVKLGKGGTLPHLFHGEGGNALVGLQALVMAMSERSLVYKLGGGDDDDTLADFISNMTPSQPPIMLIELPANKRNQRASAGAAYVLDAALIKLEDPNDRNGVHHVVSGLTCNGVPYVYDSNNYVAQTDWPNGVLTGYADELKRANAEYAHFDIYLHAVVYVRRPRQHRMASPVTARAATPAPSSSSSSSPRDREDLGFGSLGLIHAAKTTRLSVRSRARTSSLDSA